MGEYEIKYKLLLELLNNIISQNHMDYVKIEKITDVVITFTKLEGEKENGTN